MNGPPLVYVAGPLSSRGLRGVADACHDGSVLRDMGCVPVIPHLCWLWNRFDRRPESFWIDYGLALVERCDFLVRLPGPSEGSDNEERHAERHGVPIIRAGPSHD